ncbi:MAG: lipopolysaccharide biosynthesis protein RfbH [Bacteroidota bacterium]|jgi:CDP-6-deoxy-D-xylo-4-hexulose-3-dehydrase|nr:lipopolysaccharide biosynthesis protein RfbH [Bacteroidota bacterium]
MSKLLDIKHQIHELIKEYHDEAFKQKAFIEGETHVPVSGKVFDHRELQYITDSALDAWFTTGKFNAEFEKKLAKYINVKSVLTVNSGSSANLVAFSALTAKELGDEAIKPGDEVITVAASFPTTVNPILQYGAIPVFLDVTIPYYEINVEDLEKALSSKTKAIVIAHTMGNVFNLDMVTAFCEKHDLWLMEDCCDALGATYNGKHVGTFGDIATLSFYPAHHITMGEGGAVYTSNSKLKKIAESFRDWGRDCWCEPGKDNTCGLRFCQQLGDLPMGYDHKYIYSRQGFNLKITDMQASLGLAQLEKLDDFVNIRRKNFDLLTVALQKHSDKLILPEATPNSKPSWFGFLITVKKNAGISRNELVQKLNDKKVATRLLFAGDLRKQPYFKDLKYRVIGDLPNTDTIVTDTFWIGVTPMINEEMISYIGRCFDEIL